MSALALITAAKDKSNFPADAGYPSLATHWTKIISYDNEDIRQFVGHISSELYGEVSFQDAFFDALAAVYAKYPNIVGLDDFTDILRLRTCSNLKGPGPAPINSY